MSHTPVPHATPDGHAPAAPPCVMVIFGASGDLTKRLLMPALYNLLCDGLLSPQFAIVGVGRTEMTAEQFRARMTEDIQRFATRPFDAARWSQLSDRLAFLTGDYGDVDMYRRLAALVAELDATHQTHGNVLVYLAMPPNLFGQISQQVHQTDLMKRARGWTRLIVEKPFGHDLASAVELNQSMRSFWQEEQLYRIDHYLGKETVQNLLVFRFSNGIFEPLWNKNFIDHIQLTVAETVGVEGRGGYYERTGVLRDMIQNHMFQMLAYLCMEPPSSFRPDTIRNEKVKLLEAIRILTPREVLAHTVRGQYGPGTKGDGLVVGYREEPGVAADSQTETFAAMRLFIDNWRWEGVPIYLRSGKNLWKRGTEIVVQFRKAPEVMFRDTAVGGRLEGNRLIFHIQPEQGIELRFQAKTPGPITALQKVNMRFDYKEAFEAQRGTGYEAMLYACMAGDATLFSRSDLVETAWKIARPILDTWANTPQTDFPNYPAGSWGPKSAFDLLHRDGRRWLEVIPRPALEKVSLLKGANPALLSSLAMVLEPVSHAQGEFIIHKGDVGAEMYFLCRGQLEVLDDGKVINTLREGDTFGELALLHSQPRAVSMRALTPCELLMLTKADFSKALKEYPDFAASLRELARQRRASPDVS